MKLINSRQQLKLIRNFHFRNFKFVSSAELLGHNLFRIRKHGNCDYFISCVSLNCHRSRIQ